MSAPRARVIGIGQPFAGDDAVGIEVVRRFAEEGVPDGVEVVLQAEPSALVDLLEGVGTVVVVDAVVGAGRPGRVLEMDGAALPAEAAGLLSTHGLGVADAIGLARALSPDRTAGRIAVVGVTIVAGGTSGAPLTSRVAAAVGPAVAAVRRLLGA